MNRIIFKMEINSNGKKMKMKNNRNSWIKVK